MTQLSHWNFKMFSWVGERPLVFTAMWFEAYAPKRTPAAIQRVTHWTLASPGSPRRYTRRWKACENRFWGNFPDHFSDSVILIHDNVRLGTCRRISIGKCYSISHTAQIWHQEVFICVPPWRNTYQDIMKCDTFMWLTQHGHTFSASWKNNLILWLVFQPTRGMCWKCTSYSFIVYC